MSYICDYAVIKGVHLGYLRYVLCSRTWIIRAFRVVWVIRDSRVSCQSEKGCQFTAYVSKHFCEHTLATVPHVPLVREPSCDSISERKGALKVDVGVNAMLRCVCVSIACAKKEHPIRVTILNKQPAKTNHITNLNNPLSLLTLVSNNTDKSPCTSKSIHQVGAY